MPQHLQKITLSAEEIELLSELSGVKIYTRNVFEHNQKEISDLMEQGKNNALVYLARNKLGQKLSLFEENNLYKTLLDLQKMLGLKAVPRRIECYDISHLSGTFVYGSMVTFIDGRPAKKFYRLFKCTDKNDDFANHREVLTRRFTRYENQQKTLENADQKKDSDKGWDLPDLIIVDGGKGQLSADNDVLIQFGLVGKIALCGLAKKEEEVFVMDEKNVDTTLPRGVEGGLLASGQVKFLIQRIRDEAHRFAITNNRNARLKTASKSQLDEITGIGEKTKKKLLTAFGSIPSIVEQVDKNPELVTELVGEAMFKKIQSFFGLR